MRLRCAAAIVMLAGLGGFAAQEPPPPAASTTLARTGSTITGQPISLPPAPFEVVFTRTVLPPGGVLPMHKHPWPRYALVESGRIRVRYEAAGIEREFGPGDALIETVDEWHEGATIGAEPVRILVIDHVPPGQTNLVRR